MTVGIVGAGQLGRMVALAGYPLGQRFVFLDPAADACAGQIGPLINAPYDDEAALAELAQRTEVVTFEFENVPSHAVESLARQVLVYPLPDTLEIAQDRLHEKQLFGELGIATASYEAVDSLEELRTAADNLGYPALLKTRRLGYDGKGQSLLRGASDVEAVWNTLGGVPLILEAFVDFERELSLVAARSRDGTMACYPLSENEHRGGILRVSKSCHDVRFQAAGEAIAEAVMRRLDYVGVLAIEFFQSGEELIANEMAPRVHNSGHWTIEGAETSQFENHLRAILGLPLGSTAARGCAAMVNFVGRLPDIATVTALPHVHFHDYGKAPRAGRKVGHATIACTDPKHADEVLTRLVALSDACSRGELE
ncbi:MAG: 5-(carboxyamino)imidazole ribonucleotide synthase [Pseudomonadota bacterium]|nr:MAG: 5-(carboxyamino)imidazole ribonucleotide synthase [Pseudomonadota bacterium]